MINDSSRNELTSPTLSICITVLSKSYSVGHIALQKSLGLLFFFFLKIGVHWCLFATRKLPAD
ncbi:uncharacterized protein TRIVIDRAFT_212592 [Trichoderma virens Gv29-8]|uniref:Uncharacterized protein n=1 Tax=Hypocrea virens (strain Gv29-8 / FGSC 10586) TaxID=413071 RepID=G9MP29_HYPVG|nr:uncharacterized protein TRIVIDRAFT_212592 [Trichoderma virens Gv29-8]EHK23631.1 hypothetical protein TRIVIDRAFT_212592 [Trichoderma virens Gv29-8]